MPGFQKISLNTDKLISVCLYGNFRVLFLFVLSLNLSSITFLFLIVYYLTDINCFQFNICDIFISWHVVLLILYV